MLLLANGPISKYDAIMRGGEGPEGPANLHKFDIGSLEKNWQNATSKKAKRAVIEDALEMVFYHSPKEDREQARRQRLRKMHRQLPPSQKDALPYMPERIRDRLRRVTIGEDLLKLREGPTGPAVEWRAAVAKETEEQTIPKVSRLYGVPERTVRRWKAEFKRPKENGNGGRPRSELSRSTYRFIRENIQMVDFPGRDG